MYHSETYDVGAQEDDSPWMDEGDDVGQHNTPASAQHELAVSTQEWEKLSVRYSDAGYREGITAGKNSHLQAGFDQGFTTAAPFAREVGNLRGIAASLLSILTTASGAKHAGAIDSTLGQQKEALVGELRGIVTALGKLDEVRVLPVDEEAEEHAKSHEDEGISQVLADRKEMREMEAMLSGLGGGKGPEPAGLDDCKARLGHVLKASGLDGVIPFRG